MSVYERRDINERLGYLGASPLYEEGRDLKTNYKGVDISGIIEVRTKQGRKIITENKNR
ncbi:hypothetical protein HYT57_03835 [Candidatus Woesearchaeota archaeon]|nr:hypothetical protein [Candidatus Woesearchaeota archaeon]